MQLNIEYIKFFEHEEEEDYQLKNILIKLRHTQLYAFDLTSPFPLSVRTMWMTPYLDY